MDHRMGCYQLELMIRTSNEHRVVDNVPHCICRNRMSFLSLFVELFEKKL